MRYRSLTPASLRSDYDYPAQQFNKLLTWAYLVSWGSISEVEVKDIVVKPVKKYPYTIAKKYAALKSRSVRRGIECTLSEHEFTQLVLQKDCYYCHITMETVTLDRKDNKQGYRVDNLVACCKSCNTVKNNVLSHDEMIVFCKWVERKRGEPLGSLRHHR